MGNLFLNVPSWRAPQCLHSTLLTAHNSKRLRAQQFLIKWILLWFNLRTIIQAFNHNKKIEISTNMFYAAWYISRFGKHRFVANPETADANHAKCRNKLIANKSTIYYFLFHVERFNYWHSWPLAIRTVRVWWIADNAEDLELESENSGSLKTTSIPADH